MTETVELTFYSFTGYGSGGYPKHKAIFSLYADSLVLSTKQRLFRWLNHWGLLPKPGKSVNYKIVSDINDLHIYSKNKSVYYGYVHVRKLR